MGRGGGRGKGGGRGRKALEANMLSLLEGDCIEWTALGSRCRCSETIWLAF